MLAVLQAESVPCLFFVTAASCSDDPGMLWYEELYHAAAYRRRAAEAFTSELNMLRCLRMHRIC
jgi:hypothetical protein